MRREVEDVNDAIFAELTYHAAYEPVRAVRTERWKYIRRFGDRLRPVLSNTDDSPTKDLLLAGAGATSSCRARRCTTCASTPWRRTT